MKNYVLFTSLFLFSISFSQQIPSQRTCGTNAKMQELINANPSFALHHQETMQYIRNYANNIPSNTVNTVITIPVVVHVLYKNSTQNISDAQGLSQIAILNQDYTKTNTDFSTVVPAAFQPYAANC